MPKDSSSQFPDYHGGVRNGIPKFSRKMIATIIAVLFAATAAVLLTGRFMMLRYRSNVEHNSASLLKEYSSQVCSSVEESLNHDWHLADYVAATLEVANTENDDEIFTALQKLRSASNIKNINLYSKDGHEIDADGHDVTLPEASKHIYEAEKNGRYLVVVQSDIYFIRPVSSDLEIGGSQLAAVSVVVNLNDFVNNMGITSFDNSSLVYLTQQNGLVISSNAEEQSINIRNLFEDSTVRSLDSSSDTVEEALYGTGSYSFIYQNASKEDYYLVIESVDSDSVNDWNIVFEAPVDKVDQSINSYSSFITKMYTGFAAVIGLAILLTWWVYNNQRRKNLAEVFARERMLNLLVTNTNYVFALYKLKSAKPVFISSNAENVLGEENLLEIDDVNTEHVAFKYKSNENDAKIKDLNEMVAMWNQKSDFQSNSYNVNVNGAEKYFRLHLYPVVDSEAELLVIYVDTTEERQREIALEQALAMADEANKAKTKFLSNMSHDIRTPMNAIVNMTDFSLQSMDDKEHLQSYLQTIKLSSSHLLKLINDVLDMSRIESGKTIVEREPFSIQTEMDMIKKIIEPLCRYKHQKFSTEIQIEHEKIYGDSLKMRQILINLLNNAVKFTPDKGEISLIVKENPSIADNHVSYTFIVKDNGIGMSQNDLKVIFEPFSRIENGTSGRIEGTGLGLSICKSFVDAMGGHISVISHQGTGSTFTVILPFEILSNDVSIGAEVIDENISFQGKHVLLVEDNDINQTIATMMLEKLGFSVTVAKDGREGYTKFLTSQPYQFDLIFMDIQMPVMNGYEAAEAIRSSNHPQAQSIPIIAMTANVFKEDVAKARSSGMNAHIGKPLEMKDIIRAASRSLKREED